MEIQELKATDLMVGDWVKDKYMHVKFQIFKIYGNVVNHAPHSDSGFLETEIEPIPITPEILEKNGFYEDKFGAFRLLDEVEADNPSMKLLGHSNNIDELIVSKGDNYMDIEIHHVHELQHALRLCKINKKIIL